MRRGGRVISGGVGTTASRVAEAGVQEHAHCVDPAAWRGGSPTGTPPPAPPRLIGGAKYQSAVSIDWLRVSLGRDAWSKWREMAEGLFGSGEVSRGRYFMSRGLSWFGGAAILVCGDGPGEPDRCVFELSGSVLKALGPDAVDSLLLRLGREGVKFCRVDFAVDYVADGGELQGFISSMSAACCAGELVGARTFSLVEKRSCGVLSGQTLYIGTRGSGGSGRFWRWYDKGLKEGTHAPGRWVRAELEASGDVALELVRRWLESVPDDRAAVPLSQLDFRVVTGRAELDRRPRSEWWHVWCQVEPSLVRLGRQPSTVTGYLRWLREAVVPGVLGVASASGVEVGRVLAVLAGDVEPGDVRERWALVDAVRRVAGSGFVVAGREACDVVESGSSWVLDEAGPASCVASWGSSGCAADDVPRLHAGFDGGSCGDV